VWATSAKGSAKEERMTDQAASRYESTGTGNHARSGWAVGFIVFAAIMMMMAGLFQFTAGLVAIFQNEFFVATRNYIFKFDATTWGWIHVLLGIVVGVAGFGLLAGRTWARVLAITMASLSAVANFLFLPYYPIWALIIITLDVLVIWAVAAHGRELATT
jgi:hypothetical protein